MARPIVPGPNAYRGKRAMVLLLLLWPVLAVTSWGQQATVTTLALSASAAPAGTVVTLTATVNAGDALPVGMVNFCDATAAHCTDVYLLGSAQVTAAGTATVRLTPAIGTHSYLAVYVGTTELAPSTSVTATLVVTGVYPTTTSITTSGGAGNYTLTATVSEIGGKPSFTGPVSFLDLTNNSSLATAALGPSTPAINFSNSSNPEAGNNPRFVAVADFNGDGKLDIATANFQDNTVTVFLGNGDGTFTAQPAIAVGMGPTTLAVGDFNSDGIPDLAVSNIVDGTTSILLGNGDGTFTAPPTPSIPSASVALAVADFNGDGIPDIATNGVGFPDGNGGVAIFLGNGDGTFTPLDTPSPETGPNPQSMAVGDFNGDGKLDLAVSNIDDATGADSVTILLGTGNGSFTAAANLATNLPNPDNVAAADFNGDGLIDLAVATYNSSVVTIFLGQGDGTFRNAGNVALTSNTSCLAVADFNGDGIPDLAVQFGLLLGNGDGTFTASANPPDLPFSPIAVGDFNGDGIPDLTSPFPILNNQAITVLVTQPTQTATATTPGISVAGAGSNQIQASYPGDANYAASTSATIPLLAGALARIQASVNGNAPTPYGPLSVTVTVSGINQATPVPTGSVFYFLDNFTAVPVPGTLTNGSITFTPPQIAVGNHFINFSYSGDANYAGTPNNVPPASLAIPFFVVPGTLTVTANSLSSPYGQSLPALTDTITGFLYNDTPASALTGAPALTTTATSTSAPGSYPITAAPGTLAASNYNLVYAPGTLTINPATDTLAVAATPSPVRTPNTVSISAALTTAASGATGTVSFMDGATILGQAPLSPTGTAALNGLTLAVGSHNITAAYSGNADFMPSTSPAVSVFVESLPVQLASIAPTLATMGAADTPITATGLNFTAASILNFNGTPLATTYVSATQLQGVIPAALLAAAGNATVTITDAPSASTSQAAAFSIVPPVQVTFSGPPTSNPGNQPPLTFQLQQAFPTELDGVMTLSFTPTGGSPDNPQVQFASGGRSFSFTLAANTTITPAIMLQAGTVAGTISVSLQLSSAGVDVTPASIAPIAIGVPEVAPTVSSVSFSASGTTLTVLVSGYSSTRDIQQATFSFTPATGVTLASTSLMVPASTLFETWYTAADSGQYGSSFTYTQTFTLSGMASQVAGVGVTLTNSVGTSTEVTSP